MLIEGANISYDEEENKECYLPFFSTDDVDDTSTWIFGSYVMSPYFMIFDAET